MGSHDRGDGRQVCPGKLQQIFAKVSNFQANFCSVTSGQSSGSWCAITNCGHVITNVSVLHLNIAANRMASTLACGVPSSTSYIPEALESCFLHNHTHTHCYLATHKHSCYHKNIDSRLPPPSCLANQFSFLPYMSWFLAACVCVTRGMLCVCVSLHSFPPPPLLKSTQHVVIH